MNKAKNYVLLWSTLMVVWLVLNDSLNSQIIYIGAGVSFILMLMFAPNADIFGSIKLNPKAIVYSIIYVFIFILELIKANIDVAYRVITPQVKINPGIVEIKTKLKSQMGRIALANSITLTPGTLTVDIKGDSLFIHWIDVTVQDIEGTTQEIAATFEKYLEVMYG